MWIVISVHARLVNIEKLAFVYVRNSEVDLCVSAVHLHVDLRVWDVNKRQLLNVDPARVYRYHDPHHQLRSWQLV